jgi:hypothetical protein
MTTLVALAKEVLSDVSDPFIYQSFTDVLACSLDELNIIEQSFITLTSHNHSPDALCRFFHNWSMTNNSASALSGYCNRLTRHWLKNNNATDTKYLNVLSHLHRVCDEDLGATGGLIHYDMYYRMATMVCGNDDWLSHQYVIPQAEHFKQWKNRHMLKNKDLLMGLLVTLIHEIYTHSEVEFIYPLFSKWLTETTQLSDKERKICISWIDVHCKGTERNHFNHTLEALNTLSEVLQVEPKNYEMDVIFHTYLNNKANVMSALSSQLQQNVTLAVK